jgi:hypothetical protein
LVIEPKHSNRNITMLFLHLGRLNQRVFIVFLW